MYNLLFFFFFFFDSVSSVDYLDLAGIVHFYICSREII